MYVMPWYRCFVRGENFLKADTESGRIERFGFYTTRWFNADSPEKAEASALAQMRSEDTFAPPPGHAALKDAMVYFEEIVEVDGPRAHSGATWFPMEEDGGV